MNKFVQLLAFVGLLVISGNAVGHSETGRPRIVSFDRVRHFAAVMQICRENCKNLGQCDGFEPGDPRACLRLQAELQTPVASSDYTVAVIERNNEASGFIQYSLFSGGLFPPSITLLAVSNNSRRFHLGSQLLRHAENAISMNGGQQVVLTTLSEQGADFCTNQNYVLKPLHPIFPGCWFKDL